MAGVKFVVFLVAVHFQWKPVRADTEVSCIFMESCILPCTFQAGDIVIHWLNTFSVNPEETIHSYYSNNDQLSHQTQRFKGRTSLFKDQISRGNASLQLTGVEVQDQGRYKCYTSTMSGNKDSFINLRVDAPVRKVSIQQVENRMTCSSDGIYPEPKLTWSHHLSLTSSPSNISEKPRVRQTEQQLYNISSSLTLSDNGTYLVYSCTVSTRSKSRKATLRQLSPVEGPGSETTIPCNASNTPLTGFSLVWIFNHSQLILNRTEADVSYTVSEEWRRQVKDVSNSGSLTLQDLSSKHEGTYTCELSNTEETYITNTFLSIKQDGSTNVAGIVVGVVAAICLVILVLVVYWLFKKDGQTNRTGTRDPQNPGPSNGVSNQQTRTLLNKETAERGDDTNNVQCSVEMKTLVRQQTDTSM